MTETGARAGAAVDRVADNAAETIAGLQSRMEELRGTVASLSKQMGDDVAAASRRGMSQARQRAGEFADRAGEGAAALRGQVEEQPLSSMAVAFVGGMAAGIALGFLLTNRPGNPPRRR